MTNKAISGLTAATVPLVGTELVPVWNGTATVKVAVTDLTAGRDVSTKDLTTTGNTVLGNASTDTLNVGNGDLIKDSAGNVGVGKTPAAWSILKMVQVYDACFGGYNGSNAWMSANVYYDGSYKSIIADYVTIYRQVAGEHKFYVNGAAGAANTVFTPQLAWTIDQALNLVPAVAAKGINFTANTPAAGMTSQLLNWYEERTFTPAVVGSATAGIATYGRQTGRFTRIGRLVTFQIDLAWSLGTGTGDLLFLGLPYPSAVNTGVPANFVNVALTANCYLQGWIPATATGVSAIQSPVGGGGVTSVAYVTGGNVMLSGSYIV